VDQGAHHGLAGVGVLPAVALQARPGDVHPNQTFLDMVSGSIPVATGQISGTAEPVAGTGGKLHECCLVTTHGIFSSSGPCRCNALNTLRGCTRSQNNRPDERLGVPRS